MKREHKYAEIGPACYGLNDWKTYDSCAEWCAKRGLKGKIGEPLPNLLSADVLALINADPEAFETRVRQCAYALAMEHIDCEHDQSDLGHVHE